MPNVRRAAALAGLLFIVLSLVLTYPLPVHLADAVEDRQDALLNVWITAWDGHQLLHDPLHLFDANIFYPYRRTLAYSELLLGNGLLALPITAASGNPVLGYNVALLLSFVLSGWGTYLLVTKLVGSPGAGLVAGTIFAFCSYRMTNLAQAQLLATQWMPLSLLALRELLRRPSPKRVTVLVLFFSLQALSSFYYGILLAMALIGCVVFEFMRRPDFGLLSFRRSPSRRRNPRSRSAAIHFMVAGGACVLVLLPFAVPYFQVQRELGFERSLVDSEPFSASLRQYLLVPPDSVLHGRWLPSDEEAGPGGYPVDALFPGLAAGLLGLWGTIRGKGRTRWFFLLLLLGALVLSFGPRLYMAPGQAARLEAALPYTWLYAIVPGFKALRAPVRFDALVMLSLAVLAGYGVAELLARKPDFSMRSGFWALALTALVVLESLVWPAAQAEKVAVGGAVPAVYGWLATQPEDPLLELPMAFTPGGPQLEYQYLSTVHWRTTPDGYSGFIPPKHGQIAYEMERFPAERSVSLLQALGVQTVVVHTERYPAARWAEMEEALSQVPELVAVKSLGPDRIYQVAERSFTTDEIAVSVYLPERASAGQVYVAYAIVRNLGGQSYAVQPMDVLQLKAEWQGRGEVLATEARADVPLVTSPHGGAAVIPLPLVSPTATGSYRLSLTDEEGILGTWWGEGAVEVVGKGEAASQDFPVPIQVAAWSVPPSVQAGGALEVDLAWRALGKVDAYYSVYVKLLDAEGTAVTGWDGQPQGGAAPTLSWVPGSTIEDRVALAVPEGLEAGEYAVEAGMYRAGDLARCLTLDVDGVPVGRVVLGTVRVDR